MRMKQAAAALGVALLVVGATPAGARPSDATLIGAGARQDGNNWTWTEVGPAGKALCYAQHADGIYEYPSAASAQPGQHTLRIRLTRDERPSKRVVYVTPIVDPGLDDRLTRRAATELVPVRRGGRTVAWDVTFDALLIGDLYIDATIEWRERGTCGGTETSSWLFHVRAP